jgi:hypothetical protein
LPSQPTLSRFEHTVASRLLLAMSEALADTVIARHRRRRRVYRRDCNAGRGRVIPDAGIHPESAVEILTGGMTSVTG